MFWLTVYTGRMSLNFGRVGAQLKSNLTDHWMSLRHYRNENEGKDFQKHPKDSERKNISHYDHHFRLKTILNGF